ncbi:hypothetical protein B0O80DRAFT_120475 [Mortierella sp. GBAus27b]|nr:hypothetical protein B0O80DRAFT_120475 [Mortierella sp. GBAus27b]
MNKVPGTTQLLVAGGETTSNFTSSPILLYDTLSKNSTSKGWFKPQLPAKATRSFRRLYHASITTGKDGVLLHGGYQTTVKNGTVVPSMVTLKASNNFAPQSIAPVTNATNAPALARHAMVLTADGHAIILGGVKSRGVLANFTTALIMDTQSISPQWKTVPLLGNPPEPRIGFTAVMVNSTTLLVYGGTKNYKSAYWTTFYLDLPSWTWSSPIAQGTVPRRWGHTATMAGSTMIVTFGLTSNRTTNDTRIALLDTTTNTWISQYRPQTSGSSTPNSQDSNGTGGSGSRVALVLGLAFLVTALLVGGVFYLFVRRTKRKTRNTMARENQSRLAPRAALGTDSHRGLLERMTTAFGLSSVFRPSKVHRDDSKRYSEGTLQPRPQSIVDKMTQLGHSPVDLGYPESLVRQGTGLIPISDYAYPNYAYSESEMLRDGHETRVVFHDLTLAQKEALKLMHGQDGHKIIG